MSPNRSRISFVKEPHWQILPRRVGPGGNALPQFNQRCESAFRWSLCPQPHQGLAAFATEGNEFDAASKSLQFLVQKHRAELDSAKFQSAESLRNSTRI